MIQPARAYDEAAFGLAVAKARRKAGLTLDQLVARSGVSRRHLIDIEHGNKTATVSLLYAISVGLGVDGGDLYRQGIPSETPSPAGSQD